MLELSDFVQRVKEIAEDSDYSRHSALQDTTNADITAAAVVLWRETEHDISKVNASELIAVLYRRYGTFMDIYTAGDDGDDHATQTTIQHMCDMDVPQGLRQNVIEAIGQGRIERWKDKGYQVVDFGGSMDLRMLVNGEETDIHVFSPEAS